MHPESDPPGNEPNLELPSLGFGRRKKRDRKRADDVRQEAGAALEEAVPGTTQEDVAPTAPRAPDAPTATTAPTAPGSPAPRAPSAPTAPPTAPGVAGAGVPPRPPARPAARPPARPPSRPATTPGSPGTSQAAPAQPRPATPAAAPPTVQPPTPPSGPTPPPADPGAPEPPVGAPLGEPSLDPLDRAAEALDSGRGGRRSRRSESRAEAKARRRADKQARKAAQRAAREGDEDESIGGATPALPPETAGTGDDAGHDVIAAAAEDDGAERLAVTDKLVARLPGIPPLVAAILTGTLTGVTAVALAFGAARGCDSVRGTESCGGGIGLLAIVAILAIEVVIGANLLKAWQIADPYSTSFLGVGLVATLAMLIFLDDLSSPWMFLVIPLMTAAAFALSWWVTVRFIDEHPMASEVDSERGEPDFDDDAGPVPPQDEARREDSTS